ncbi:FadR/GntR family transcriptional regulator [Acrocarpospora catenulata]|uniref:FadR/GntR family transcriptional regulator n=1 Tax=Acrocarpospora catenulata TaxID=2836182 RepID=UPI001BD991DB|nr:GntR family transcriptional regulator [Acrocarpospora catenulata]
MKARGIGAKQQMSQPSIGEMVANILRARILAGELPKGSLLPRQEDLMREFNVSRPPLREALRILEADGLITVRRGNIGGAEVRAPDRSGVASALALLLQFEDAPLKDLADALVEIEPLCAGLAAQREDREEAVVAQLLVHLERQREHLDNGAEFTAHSRAFHETLIDSCGNATIRISVGALAMLWSMQEQAWANAVSSTDNYPPVEQREKVLEIHEEIVDAIRKGHSAHAMTLARAHAQAYPQYVLATGERRRIILTNVSPTNHTSVVG